MLVGEFEVVSTTEAVTDIIKGYRFRKYGLPRWNLFEERFAKPESGFEFEIIDWTSGNGQVLIYTISTEVGVKVRIETNSVTGGQKKEVSPEQYARELIAEIEAKTKQIASELEKPNKKNAGAKGLACNVWLDYMIDEKGWDLGTTQRNNKLYEMWKELWELEHGVKIDDEKDGLKEPWDSYRKGYQGRHKRKK